VSSVQKKELLDFIRNTRNKEEYKRALAVKQKMEGLSYRTIAKNIGVNYMNMNIYRIVDAYRQERLNGIRSKRNNAGRIPKISSEKNKQMIKDVVINKSPKTFRYLKNTWNIRLLAKHLSKELRMNVSPMQT